MLPRLVFLFVDLVNIVDVSLAFRPLEKPFSRPGNLGLVLVLLHLGIYVLQALDRWFPVFFL